jgi:hypothetical protein
MPIDLNRQLYKDAAQYAYSPDPPGELGDGFGRYTFSPTLKFWSKGNVMLVGIRGTADKDDLFADLMIGSGNLEYTRRFRTDELFMKQVQASFVGTDRTQPVTYYGAGHSLGGAILDLFIQKGYISSGVSYNGALQIGKEQILNRRVYATGDPLYMLSRSFLSQDLELREKEDPKPLYEPINYLLHQHGISDIGAGKPSKKPNKRRYGVS